jgi:riboflavin kinase/FMN adenylyltransferase
LDFQGDLYGQKITLEFITRLRGEQRFANASVLVNQIRQDIINVREALALEGQLQD